MVETVIHTIGRGGDFATLADWAAALPEDIAAAGICPIAELLAGAEDPGCAVIRTRCSDSCFVTIRAARGHGFADLTDPLGDPLAPAMGFGATVRAHSGAGLEICGAGTRVALYGLQIVAEDAPAITDDGEGMVALLSGCLVEAVSAAPAATVRGAASTATATVVVQRGTGDGLCLADGARAQGCTIFKPNRPLADGTGISADGQEGAQARSTAVFGFARAFGVGVLQAKGLVTDQMNALTAPDRLEDPSWTPRQLMIEPRDTRPGPFGVALQRLWGSGDPDARLDGPPLGELGPGQRASFAVIVAEPSALTSALALECPAGKAELRVSWVDTPPATALSGRPDAFAATGGGVTRLGNGLFRLWIEAENRTQASLSVRPMIYATRGLANAGLSVGLFAGAAMAAIGHIGRGFCRPGQLCSVSARGGIDPADALVNTSAILPDLRPLEGGPLEGAGSLAGRDILGRGRLVPDTVGAFTLNPAPQFLGTLIQGAGKRRAADLIVAASRQRGQPPLRGTKLTDGGI